MSEGAELPLAKSRSNAVTAPDVDPDWDELPTGGQRSNAVTKKWADVVPDPKAVSTLAVDPDTGEPLPYWLQEGTDMSLAARSNKGHSKQARGVRTGVDAKFGSPMAKAEESDGPDEAPQEEERGPSLDSILAGWSVADIKQAFKGNTETASDNYAAASLLRSEFKSNWFRAKEHLLETLGGKNPEGGDDDISRKANAIMQGLHGLRAYDMEEVFRATRQEMKELEPGIMLIEHLKQQRDNLRAQVEDRSSSLYNSEDLANGNSELEAARKKLAALRDKLLEKKEEMLLKWGSAGSTTITSDIDSNPKGAYSVLTVRKFNEMFRRAGCGGKGWAFEPGTVYDINVYGQDYMGNWPPFDVTKDADSWSMTTHQEVEFGEKAAKEFNDYQEQMAYLHVLKYIDHGAALDHRIPAESQKHPIEGPEWSAYKARLLSTASGDAHEAALTKNITAAEEKYVEFRRRFLEAQRIVAGESVTATDPLLIEMMKPAPESAGSIDERLAAAKASKKPVEVGKVHGKHHAKVQLGVDREMLAGLEPDAGTKPKDEHADRQFDLDVIAMVASNRIYEQMEIEVIKARETYRTAVDNYEKVQAAFEAHDPDGPSDSSGMTMVPNPVAARQWVETTGLNLKKAMVDALYFANEVYMTQGAVEFAVLFKQGMGKDARLAQDLQGGDAIEKSLNNSKEMFLHSFIENVGDSLKELNHMKPETSGAVAITGAAKYLDRMMESAENLLGDAYGNFLAQWPELVAVREVAAAKAEIKANVDLKGTADLRMNAKDPVVLMLAWMRNGKPFDEFKKENAEAYAALRTNPKVNMRKVEAHWGERSIEELDKGHKKAMRAGLDKNTLETAADLRALVIDFGAEVPKYYYKHLPATGTTFAKTGAQKTNEAEAAKKPTTIDADMGPLMQQFKDARTEALKRRQG